MRLRSAIASLLLAGLLFLGPASAQKDQPWIEIRSPNFVVVTTSGEKVGRNIAEQFEAFRSAFSQQFPAARVELGKPLIIFAVKDERGLRELLPAFWEKRGRAQPGGVFVSSQEKLYVALRTDMRDVFPYQVVYHEYAHALMRLNFRDLPLWLDEGLAEIFGNSLITSSQVTMGRPSSRQLLLLQRSRGRLLSLENLLAVKHDSPQYNEEDWKALFYAQAWALTHYIYLSQPGRDAQLLTNYMRAYSNGASSREAAKVFGDLKQLERTLDDYVHQKQFFYMKTKPAAGIDKDTFAARPLSPAESAALRGDFFVHTHRPAEARAALDQALRLNPSSALAHESMGVLHLRQKEMDAALPWFEKAVALDSGSFLAHYFTAMLSLSRGASGELGQIEARLLRSIELNKDFAPAYSMLASVYSSQDGKLDDALQAARRAAQLEPGTLQHHIQVAHVLLRMGRAEEAIRLARSVAAAARNPMERFSAESFIQNAERYVAQRKAFEAAKKDVEEHAARRAAEFAAKEKVAAERAAELRLRDEHGVDPSGQQGIARGIITEVNCTGPRALGLSLALSAFTLQLRAANRAQVPYYISGPQVSEGSREFDPCKELRGHRAAVTYRPVKGQAYAGEIMSIELVTGDTQSVAEPAAGVPAGSNSSPQMGGTLIEGVATAVSCPGTAILLTVRFGDTNLRLRADDRSRVHFTHRGKSPAASFNPCADLGGQSVAVIYNQDQNPGRIVAVDVPR